MVSADVGRSLRRRLVLIVVVGAVVPLGLVGLWTTRTAARSGRALLASQLEAQVSVAADGVARQWAQYRGDLMMLGESEPTRIALRDTARARIAIPSYLERAFAGMTAFNRVTIRDRTGQTLWTLSAPGTPANGREEDARVIAVRVPVTDLATGEALGTIDASLRVAALIPSSMLVASPQGPLTAVFAHNEPSVTPSGADERLFTNTDLEWSGHRWLTVRRPISDLGIELAMAGALDPYVTPFESSARWNAGILLVAASVIVLAMVVLTGRMGRDVQRQLAHREALATVGEFASELAHEVRNPLTAMRLDLQRIEEEADRPTTVRGIAPRVLHQIDRLDRAVGGALRVARSGSMTQLPVGLRELLEAACRSAAPEFARRNAKLDPDFTSADNLILDGDAGALEQLFLNLLINAAQALPAGGEARLSASRRDDYVDVTIKDNGVGMSARQLAEVGEPFRSSRRDGTGLGLKIARRIAATHRGAIDVASTSGVGTTVRVSLPLAQPRVHPRPSDQRRG